MQVQRISNNTSFSGIGNHYVRMAEKQEENVMETIRRASKKRHRRDRDTFVKEKWNNFLNERVAAGSERGINMEKVLKESSHDREMDRRRNRR